MMKITDFFPETLDLEFCIRGYENVMKPFSGAEVEARLLSMLEDMTQGKLPEDLSPQMADIIWQLFCFYRVLVWDEPIDSRDYELLNLVPGDEKKYAMEFVQVLAQKYIGKMMSFQLVLTDECTMRERYLFEDGHGEACLILYLLKCFNYARSREENQKVRTCAYCGFQFVSDGATRPYRYCKTCRDKYGRDALYKRSARMRAAFAGKTKKSPPEDVGQ